MCVCVRRKLKQVTKKKKKASDAWLTVNKLIVE